MVLKKRIGFLPDLCNQHDELFGLNTFIELEIFLHETKISSFISFTFNCSLCSVKFMNITIDNWSSFFFLIHAKCMSLCYENLANVETYGGEMVRQKHISLIYSIIPRTTGLLYMNNIELIAERLFLLWRFKRKTSFVMSIEITDIDCSPGRIQHAFHSIFIYFIISV